MILQFHSFILNSFTCAISIPYNSSICQNTGHLLEHHHDHDRRRLATAAAAVVDAAEATAGSDAAVVVVRGAAADPSCAAAEAAGDANTDYDDVVVDGLVAPKLVHGLE